MPNRSFWIEAKESLEQNAKTMPMSSRILGIGIIFVAFIVLSIGLIVGLKFPGFVEDRIKEDQCVVSEEYSHYNQWVRKLNINNCLSIFTPRINRKGIKKNTNKQ